MVRIYASRSVDPLFAPTHIGGLVNVLATYMYIHSYNSQGPNAFDPA